MWLETFPKLRTGSGTTRIRRVGCGKAKRGFASRIPPSPGVTARRTGGAAGGESDPPFFGAGAPPVRVKGDTACATLYPPLSGEVALSTVIPGGKAIEPIRKPKRPHRPQAARYARKDAGSGNNNRNAERADTGAVTQHCAGDDLFASLMHSGASGPQSMSRTVRAFRHCVRSSRREHSRMVAVPEIVLGIEPCCRVRRGLSAYEFPHFLGA